jgi:hypothetical protein
VGVPARGSDDDAADESPNGGNEFPIIGLHRLRGADQAAQGGGERSDNEFFHDDSERLNVGWLRELRRRPPAAYSKTFVPRAIFPAGPAGGRRGKPRHRATTITK